MGIEVASPNVQESTADFAVQDTTILFGLSAIKGCGNNAADAIVAARKKGGPFSSLFDLCRKS